MRRLPVFFVLDCSESMVGDNLKKVQDGLQAIVRALRADPHALETVYVSVVAFAGVAKTIAPLVELVSFYPPRLPLGGGTNLGAALGALMREIDKSVVRTTAERKGDWKPVVYLLTDGRPTDDPKPTIDEWNAKYAGKATMVAIGLGKSAGFSSLRSLTPHVLVFEDSHEGDFRKFINWVTASVVAQSKSVGEGTEAQALPKIDESILSLSKEGTPVADEACVTLVGRCQKNRKPYIIKYERAMQDVTTRDFTLLVARYELSGCYPLDEDYFAWSDPRSGKLTVNTSELVGSPGCPHCGNISAFAVCGCGKLMCINGPHEAVCPWCEKPVIFAPAPKEEGGFDVGRGRG